MSWHYTDGDRPVGPVSTGQVVELRRLGKITATTKVWRSGWTGWRLWDDSLLEEAGAGPAMGVAPVMAGAGASAVCIECGEARSEDDLAKFGERCVCAACKSRYLQRLREGMPVPGERLYAGFWIRLVAKFIDGILIMIPYFGFAFVVGMGGIAVGSTVRTGTAFLASQLALQLISWTITLAYNSFFVARFSATPGKLAVGIEVVTVDRTPLTWKRALARAGGELLSGLTCSIGYLLAAFDDEKRALHDHLCGTRVVHRAPPGSLDRR